MQKRLPLSRLRFEGNCWSLMSSCNNPTHKYHKLHSPQAENCFQLSSKSSLAKANTSVEMSTNNAFRPPHCGRVSLSSATQGKERAGQPYSYEKGHRDTNAGTSVLTGGHRFEAKQLALFYITARKSLVSMHSCIRRGAKGRTELCYCPTSILRSVLISY